MRAHGQGVMKLGCGQDVAFMFSSPMKFYSYSFIVLDSPINSFIPFFLCRSLVLVPKVILGWRPMGTACTQGSKNSCSRGRAVSVGLGV